jgi:hypothetical protein
MDSSGQVAASNAIVATVGFYAGALQAAEMRAAALEREAGEAKAAAAREVASARQELQERQRVVQDLEQRNVELLRFEREAQELGIRTAKLMHDVAKQQTDLDEQGQKLFQAMRDRDALMLERNLLKDGDRQVRELLASVEREQASIELRRVTEERQEARAEVAAERQRGDSLLSEMNAAKLAGGEWRLLYQGLIDDLNRVLGEGTIKSRQEALAAVEKLVADLDQAQKRGDRLLADMTEAREEVVTLKNWRRDYTNLAVGVFRALDKPVNHKPEPGDLLVALEEMKTSRLLLWSVVEAARRLVFKVEDSVCVGYEIELKKALDKLEGYPNPPTPVGWSEPSDASD